ncbi:MAG: DNA-binding protein WhiA [Erysipelotrichaceae bacterium]|nr:DNA-binding protein WhiA [Erysipelotrichaceae bacterium]MBR3694258.1 DNA-binding protein WhiA [Erysipelotrichales bacterium]
MSYTTDVKSECASLDLKECCKLAQLSALLKLCAEMSISRNGLNMIIRCENPTVAKRILKHLKDLYNVESQLSVMKKLNLKKNNIYVLRIFTQVRQILEDTCIMSDKGLESYPHAAFLRKDCCTRAYLAGSFLATGSVNDPKSTNYHLEISSTDEKHANFIMRQMNKYSLNAKVIKRRNNHVVYLKSADKISDFLSVIGAHDQLAEFEDFRIERDFVNSLKRLENCEVANEMKTQQAAKKQIEDILYIRQRLGFTTMDEKIKQVALLRLDHPEASLNELCMIYEEEYDEEISKSGMKHRLSKIKAMADRMRESSKEE